MKPKPVKGTAIMLVGAFLSIAALGLLVIGINTVGYLLGAGEEVTVTVIESSVDTGPSETHEEGYGYYEQDGETFGVHSPYMREGDEIVTRLPMIPFGFGSPTSIHANDNTAFDDLRVFIGVLVVGTPGFVMLWGGWLLATRGVNIKNRHQASGS